MPFIWSKFYSIKYVSEHDGIQFLTQTIGTLTNYSQQVTLPCSMNILWQVYFADMRLFVFCGNKFLLFKVIEISAGN